MSLPSAPAWALLAGAALWGVVWFPYRVLAHAGIDGIWATLATYGIAVVVGSIVFHRHFPRRVGGWALLMGVSIGSARQHYERAKKRLRTLLCVETRMPAPEHAS